MIVSMREMKSHLAKYVRQARAGQMIALTSHNKIVARIIGVPNCDNNSAARLLAAGVATWHGGKPGGARIVLHGTTRPIATMVLEDRDWSCSATRRRW